MEILLTEEKVRELMEEEVRKKIASKLDNFIIDSREIHCVITDAVRAEVRKMVKEEMIEEICKDFDKSGIAEKISETLMERISRAFMEGF